MKVICFQSLPGLSRHGHKFEESYSLPEKLKQDNKGDLLKQGQILRIKPSPFHAGHLHELFVLRKNYTTSSMTGRKFSIRMIYHINLRRSYL